MWIECYAPGMKVGKEYMIQPITFDDKLVSTPYGIIKGTSDGRIRIRVANLSSEEITLEERDHIATIDPDSLWVANHNEGKAFCDQKIGEKNMELNFDDLVCEQLELSKKGQLTALLRRYKEVFYKGG